MVLTGTGLLARRERCGHTGLGFSCSGAVSGQASPRCPGPRVEPAVVCSGGGRAGPDLGQAVERRGRLWMGIEVAVKA